MKLSLSRTALAVIITASLALGFLAGGIETTRQYVHVYRSCVKTTN